MLLKRYDFKEIEKDKVKKWKESGYFKAGDTSKLPFSMVIPPPNVTGILHIGHAIDNTFQDIICRYKKAKGYDVLFLPGVDHAGIATQAKVDAKLKEEGISRFDIGREAYLKEAFKWKDEKHHIIHEQWEKMGLMIDYSRERFTLDEGFSDAVYHVFKTLYDQNLIYRGERIVNYDTKMKTALSNIEIIYQEEEGDFFYFKYRFSDDKEKYLEIATTRPETMFGDTCVVINPNDERYKGLKGKMVINPANGQEIPIIEDEYVDISFGTGCMKCTPAHDPNDFIIGKKYNLDAPIIMNFDGTMNELCGKYQNMDRFECRSQLLKDIEENGDLIKIEKIKHNVGHSERTNTIVEPILSKQWFVKMEPLAKDVLKVQETSNKSTFYPKRFENVLTRWLTNIDDWCISRQLWWGHRIPVFYNKNDGSIVVSKTSPGDDYYQDEDVLDTWFSSALWPFATLGWPKETEDFKRYFPTSCIVTGYDIIFFWVSRMMFQSIHFNNKVPFKDVVIHGLVRDNLGRKMSKSLGNGVDPNDIIEKYGCDSLRYFLSTAASPGLDFRFSEEKVQASNQYLNKIWNSARYILMNLPENYEEKDFAFSEVNEIDQYILLKLDRTIAKVTEAMEKYEFGIACTILYDFVYDEFCSFYLELTKVSLSNEKYIKDATYSTLLKVLKYITLMIYPFAPFITEEIYLNLPKHKESIMLENYPERLNLEGDLRKVELLKGAIEKIRGYKVDNNLPPNSKLDILLRSDLCELETIIPYLERFSFSKVTLVSKEQDITPILLENGTFYVKEEINKDEMLQKLNQQLEDVNKEIKRSENLLNNQNFLSKAKKEKVEEEQKKYKMYLEQKNLLEEKIKKL